MGLDSYIFKTSRPAHLCKEQYTAKEIESLGLTAIPVYSMEPEKENNLRSFAKVCMIENLYYDMEKICNDYSLSENAYIGVLLGNGSIVVTDCDSDGKSRRVSISKEDIKDKYILHQLDQCYVFRRERIQMWHKNYRISDFFTEIFGPIENTTYYPISAEVAVKFNQCFDESIPTQPMPEGTCLCYYEWH